jgi:hypothetical protein
MIRVIALDFTHYHVHILGAQLTSNVNIFDTFSYSYQFY